MTPTVSYGCGILLVEPLSRIRLGGFSLGFWFAQQGAIYVFVALIFVMVAPSFGSTSALHRGDPGTARRRPRTRTVVLSRARGALAFAPRAQHLGAGGFARVEAAVPRDRIATGAG